MRPVYVFVALCAVSLFTLPAGCAEDGTTDKGVEEQALSADGKADSFFRPTEHGALAFGIDARATISADASFHAWTFTLTDAARVSLKTVISQNLDTVMYLYRRDAGSSDSWGRYIAKNDDAEKKVVWSEIADDLGAGEYRVIVKPYKAALTGPFTLASSCEGSGCAVVADCKADDAPGMPADTDFSVDCAAKLRGLVSRVQSRDSLTVKASERCKVGPFMRAGIDTYVGYWDDVWSWDDFVENYSYDDEEPELNVDVVTLENGVVVVGLDAGGDEDGLSVVFEADGTAVMAYQHNQSPDMRYFCDEGGATTEVPDESCASDALWYLHRNGDTTDTANRGTRADLLRDAREDVALAVTTFYTERSLADDAEVSMDVSEWGDGAQVTLSDAAGTTVEYVLTIDYRPRLILRTEGGTTTMPCATN